MTPRKPKKGHSLADLHPELIEDPNYSEIFCKEQSRNITEQVVKTLDLTPNNI